VPRRLLVLLVVLLALTPSAARAATGTPDQVGQWGPVMSWPLVAVHMSLLSSGNVLVWDGFEAGPNSERIYDPVTGTITPKPYARNLFCSGFSQLADGRLFIAGGHITVNSGLKDTTIWDPSSNTAQRVTDLTGGRWYPTVTTLADGRALVFSGDNIQADDSPPGNPLSFKSSTVPEVYNPATNSYQRLTGAQVDTPLYPHMFVLPDGRVFDAGPDRQSRILNPNGTGSLALGPVSPFDGSSSVMYAPGKVMKSGTWSDPSFANLPVTARTAVVDMTQPSPVWRETAPMRNPRSYETLTLLADGSSLVSGGTSSSEGYNMANAVLPAERWDPDTETWTEMANQANGRGYHSTGVLLPDGRVLIAGGGQLPGYPVTNQTNAQIYSPPYLFKGLRPDITSAPGTVQYGQGFSVGTVTPNSIRKVSLVRLGSQTHAFDQNQRYVPLQFTAGAGGLNVQAPANPNLAPPGYYMLFIVDDNGVPSVSKFVRLPAAGEDNVPPSAPGSPNATGGLGRADLSWTAASDNGSIRRYDVYRSTTSGFTPSAANRIAQPTGTSYADTPLAAGEYYYRVDAEDLAGNIGPPTAELHATVTADTTAPTVSISAPADGATVSGAITVSANAGDDVGVAGVQFKLDGANLGAEDTSAPFSTAWDTRSASNGTHTLTAVARDGAGNTKTATTVTVTASNTAPPPASGLVAAYGFDETSGSSVGDSSGRGNLGTIANATRSTAGRFGGALSFNGTNAWVTVPDAGSLDLTTAMTLEAWVRPATLGGYRTVLLKETTGNLTYALYGSSSFGGSNVARPSAWIDANGLGPTTALPTNAWSHIASTWDGATWRFFVNGTQVASKAATAAIPVSNGVLRMGGNNVWSEWFSGLIDEVRVYNRALSALEVSGDSTTPVSAPAAPDTTAPNVAVTAPAGGATVSGGSVSVAATASDDVGVAGVQFKLDGANLGGEDTTSPYGLAWNSTTATNGTHALTAVARDAAGNTRTSTTVNVTVANTPPDTIAPDVTLTAPSDGASVSGTVALTANATDDVAMGGVRFKVDGADLGAEDTSSPYAVNWDTTAVANGTHTVSAVARDAAGNLRTTPAVTVTVDNADTTAPTVSVTVPTAGASVNGTVNVTATAADAVGVTGVQFRLDGNDLGTEDSSSPYGVAWDTTAVSNGTHTLTAVARDAAGNTRTSASVTVTVANAVPDTTPPTVSLSAPADAATVNGSISVTANASDAVGVTAVQFRLDGADLGSADTTSPYAVTWNTSNAANGQHTLTAIARDAAGNTATATSVTVTVDNDKTAPTVAIGAPAGGATVTGTTDVTATATDGVGVAGVQFKLDGANLGAEDTTSPYSVAWNTTTATNGTHTLTAVARDAAGNMGTSASVSVTVSNAAPTGLVAAYAFDEASGASVTDASGSGNVGTIANAARTPAGKNGAALNFNGTNAWVTVPDANSLDLTAAMTLEAWVRPTVIDGFRTVLLKETTGNLVYGLYSSSAFGGSGVLRPSAWISANGLGPTTALPLNTWSHVATTYDRVTWRLYVNGTQVASKAMTSAIPVSTGPLRIGGNSLWSEWFSGQIDDVRVYKRALTAAEVAADRDKPVG
jgi:hypothetical protein